MTEPSPKDIYLSALYQDTSKTLDELLDLAWQDGYNTCYFAMRDSFRRRFLTPHIPGFIRRLLKLKPAR